MKKFIFSIATFLFIAGIANAQDTKKDAVPKTTPAKHASAAKKTTTANKAETANTGTVSPATTKTTKAVAIKRKHHKKKKPVTKKG